MLGASPLSVTYSFGEGDNLIEKNTQTEKPIKKGMLGVILTEKIVNERLVQYYAVPGGLSEEDKQRVISFESEISGWAYVNYKAYHSGIILFDGKATKVGENMWNISTNDGLKVEKSEFDLESNEKSNNSNEKVYTSALDKVLSYKVIFSGKIAETDQEDELITSFINSGFNSKTSQNIKLSQIGELTINLEAIVSNQDFRDPILVN